MPCTANENLTKGQPTINTENLRLDQLRYAVVPSLYASQFSDGSTQNENLCAVLKAENDTQIIAAMFRPKEKDLDVRYHTIGEGLRKRRLLVDHATQVFPDDLIDLDDLNEITEGLCSELQATDVAYVQMYDMIPVEVTRLVAETYGRLYEEALERIADVQELSMKRLRSLERFFDNQYEDAVATLMRWWRHYNDMLIARLQNEACQSDADTQVAVKEHKLQMKHQRELIEKFNKEVNARLQIVVECAFAKFLCLLLRGTQIKVFLAIGWCLHIVQ